jgi:hypothetical protein
VQDQLDMLASMADKGGQNTKTPDKKKGKCKNQSLLNGEHSKILTGTGIFIYG